eukprot:PLAT11928.1.p1 GENE.PLAT11928.1~~PLAT11928.1.p1  ORF type:complete len:134 (-),score=58.08 PLAT11928.1:155-496(-)
MRHLAAYMLLALGGNAAPSADDVKALLAEAGAEVDDAQLELLMSKLEGKNLDEVLEAGKEKLVAVPTGGGGGAAAAAGGAAAAAAEPEKEEEEEEDDAMDGGMSLFDDDDDDW